MGQHDITGKKNPPVWRVVGGARGGCLAGFFSLGDINKLIAEAINL